MFLVPLHHRFNNEIDTLQINAYNFMHLSSTTFPIVLKSKKHKHPSVNIECCRQTFKS